jgi:hypothetical protein
MFGLYTPFFSASYIKEYEMIRLCHTIGEIQECLELVYKKYSELHIANKDILVGDSYEKGIYRTLWHNLPDTVIVRAEHDNNLVATVTCVFNNEYIGMPCSKLFQDQIDEVFGVFDLLAEMTCIASIDSQHNRLVLKMLRYGRDWLFERGVHAVVGCVHPHHVKFWKELMGAVTFNVEDVRLAQHAGNAQAVWGYMPNNRDEKC